MDPRKPGKSELQAATQTAGQLMARSGLSRAERDKRCYEVGGTLHGHSVTGWLPAFSGGNAFSGGAVRWITIGGGKVAKKLTKGARIIGDRRTTLAADYAKRYESGESIRKIARDSGRSYGFVHGVLSEAGPTLRPRGGATRGPKRQERAAGGQAGAGAGQADRSGADKTAVKRSQKGVGGRPAAQRAEHPLSVS